MHIVIYGTEPARKELLKNGTQPGITLDWVSSVHSFLNYKSANAFINLSFENTDEELGILKTLKGLVVINSVIDTLAETDSSFIRINGWTGFMDTIIEASCLKEEFKAGAEYVFGCFNKSVEWLPDDPGFISCRVISMIINEAYFSLEEQVSTKENIDEAMKLGTAYPFGPFEWAKRIGLKNVVSLLTRLSKENKRYSPAALLVKEALETSTGAI